VDANDLDIFSSPAGDDYMGVESRMNGSEFEDNPEF
jgi:hypothetical protein